MDMKNRTIINTVDESMRDYLYDESRYTGSASTISFPKDVEDVKNVIKEVSNNGVGITIQGSLTGIVGAGVPHSGHIMNLKNFNKVIRYEKYNEILENSVEIEGVVDVEPGITIEELEKQLLKVVKDKKLVFPVCPTEKMATIGGILATGSNGIQSYYYGNMEQYIKEIEICTVKGEIIKIDKNDENFYKYIKSEGMYGVITKAKLKLVEKQDYIWGIMFMFNVDKDAADFVDKINLCSDNYKKGANMLAVEYYDKNTIDIIEEFKPNMSKISEIPCIPNDIKSLIYIEISSNNEEKLEETVEKLMEDAIICNSDPDIAWAMSGESEVDLLREYRHSASECVNMLVSKNNSKDNRITKLSSDIKHNYKNTIDVIEAYIDEFSKTKLDYCLFGHIGSKHMYSNIIAKDFNEYKEGIELYRKLIKKSIDNDENFINEHGIGKLKSKLYTEFLIDENKKVLDNKRRLDLDDVFNKKNRG